MAKAPRSTQHTAPTTLDPAQGAAAYKQFETEIGALSPDQLLALRVDPQLAGAYAYSIAVRDLAPERKARFEALAKTNLFQLATLDRLAKLSLAIWYARQQQSLNTPTSEATIPESLYKQAQELRSRMLRVLEHYFADDPEISRQLAAIRSGQGYQDLANDLMALADLYSRADIVELISQDPKHYRKTDVKEARTAAGKIFTALGLSNPTDAARWPDRVQRLWTMVSNTYDELQAAGRFLFRTLEDVEKTYPSLVSVTRAAPSKNNSDEEKPTPSPAPTPA